MQTRAYIHIGLPKTGTSYVQRTLWRNEEALARQDVGLLGADQAAQRAAVWDLLGRRFQGGDSRSVEGAWSALVQLASQSHEGRLLFSDETLVHARRREAQMVVRDFRPREVHVVVTVRDLARAITSMWQQQMSKGMTIGWTEFVRAVRMPDAGQATAGVAFWLRYDVPRITGMWASVSAANRIHLVMVPPAGSAPRTLFDRFALAVGIDASGLKPIARPANPGLSACNAEVLRRLNGDLADRLSEQRYREIMGRLVIAAARRDPRPLPIEFPSAHRDWVQERSEQMIVALRAGGYEIAGDWDDLRPRFEAGPAASPDDVTDSDVASASISLLSETLLSPVVRMGLARSQASSATEPRPGRIPAWASRARAARFRGRVWALQRADRSPLFAKAANAYLRRVGRHD